MILRSEDYQFEQTVSFVQLDEYYNEPKVESVRGKLWQQQLPSFKRSFLHFNSDGHLLLCRTDTGQSEEVRCNYQDGMLVSRIFIAQNGSVYRVENRIYNEENLLVEKNFQENGIIKQQVRYKYNEKFQLIEEENQKHIKLYFYNDDGLCYEQQLHAGNEHVQSCLYYYDKDNNIVELREESPIGQTCRLHKYSYEHQLVSSYQLINQDGLILTNLEYKYSNFIGNDWLERYTWRLSGRSGKLSYHSLHSCWRSPCLESSSYESYFCRDFQTLELSKGSYYGQTTNLGIMHGQGRLDFFDGSCYIGRFDNGCMDGYGCFYWPDGRVYRGYFEKNKMQGLGNYYLVDGSLYRGTFAEGQLLSSKPYYYLASTSPLSKLSRQNRRAQAANRLNRQLDYQVKDIIEIEEIRQEEHKSDDQKFIELATKAVQQKWQQESIEPEQAVLLEQTSETESVGEQHNLDLFCCEQYPEELTENFMAEDFIDIFSEIVNPEVVAESGQTVDFSQDLGKQGDILEKLEQGLQENDSELPKEFMLENVAMHCGQA